MKASDKKAAQNAALKQEIIAQSWAIIEESGWQALSIRRIAEAIEYSVPVIYKHFENKEAILEHFIKTGFQSLTDRLAWALSPGASATEQVQQLATAYWTFAATQTKHYEMMYGLGMPSCETVNNVAEIKQLSQVMEGAIQAVAEEAGNSNIDYLLKVKTFWSMLHGFIAIELFSHNQIQEEPTATFTDAIDSFIFTLINKK